MSVGLVLTPVGVLLLSQFGEYLSGSFEEGRRFADFVPELFEYGDAVLDELFT